MIWIYKILRIHNCVEEFVVHVHGYEKEIDELYKKNLFTKI